MILDEKFHGEPPTSPPFTPTVNFCRTCPCFVDAWPQRFTAVTLRESLFFFSCFPGELSLRSAGCPSRRYSGPRWRSADCLRGAGGGQDVRGGAGDDTEHEQSGRLAVQQSQEAHIRWAPTQQLPPIENEAKRGALWVRGLRNKHAKCRRRWAEAEEMSSKLWLKYPIRSDDLQRPSFVAQLSTGVTKGRPRSPLELRPKFHEEKKSKKRKSSNLV